MAFFDGHAQRVALEILFFQAEDGIRDHCVPVVQTCALPILLASSSTTSTRLVTRRPPPSPARRRRGRSEERRVGKECRCRMVPVHQGKEDLGGGSSQRRAPVT